jgi:hypothetical protein
MTSLTSFTAAQAGTEEIDRGQSDNGGLAVGEIEVIPAG